MTTVRGFRPGDVDAFLSLMETVFGQTRDREWFEWKYELNPYAEAPHIVVAERDGDLVGARPFLPLEMAVGDETHLALEPVDAMVHPDHRREGVFTAMTREGIDRYEAGEPSFFFNFPNEAVAAGSRELGWEKVEDRVTYYRFADLPEVAERNELGTGVQLAASAVEPASTGYYALREALAPVSDATPVRRDSGVHAAEFAALARRDVPDRIHAVRDETFYEWRFQNPDWEYEVYVAESREPAGLVVGTNGDVVKITDVAPVGRPGPEEVFGTLLRAVLDDHDDAALLIAPPLATADYSAGTFGFHSDRSYPVKHFATPTRHFVRSLTGEWELNGHDLTDPADWALTFAEHDTS
ncbi:GNAT family N-acetyltransferase [Halorubellus sp. JP-L1]|uniref:GNAT family N-acetyltransferase n=1 Tax=Halorubellus sp. JP-L1 TaxID=2715753 RepID=UPI00140DA26E|nr:GNAT family N-acetyltransferase [Halorubellus sp. JP-L1]NHN43179.1 GNAT family N-acetyltransferase [Halorubellus sp. JP-L1]